jgi:hypothetical protein
MIRFGFTTHSFYFLLESKTMRCTKRLFAGMAMIVLIGVAATATATWEDSKMHYPQLPNPNGWDVKLEQYYKVLGDDFLCTETGPIGGIHFWQSWQGDHFGAINSISVGIYSNNPMGAYGWSEPDQMLWAEHFDPIDIGFGATSTGDQGWFDPSGYEPGGGSYALHDHDYYRQIDLYPKPSNQFYQIQGMIYWLVLSIDSERVPPFTQAVEIGWKTSGSPRWGDAAVWASSPPGGPMGEWMMLASPTTYQPLDLAFVITGVPEPSTLALLSMAAVAMAGYAWRKRKAGC